MYNHERYLNKAINEIQDWRKENIEASNYQPSFYKKIIDKLEKAKEADSMEELDRQIKEIYRFKSDSGPLTELMPSLNELGVAIEKSKDRST